MNDLQVEITDNIVIRCVSCCVLRIPIYHTHEMS